MSDSPIAQSPLTHLGNISTEEFIRHYWQKQPLLIRQALPDFISPLTPDELAGLALEEEIESRIVLQHGATPWQLMNGPFAEETFQSLPETHWTLLIQSIDHWVPELSQLLDKFRFIPNWRLDDIMASYATRGGSVGPHYDQYDVFLLQGSGERHWQLGQQCHSLSDCLADSDLHILSEFNAEQEWVLHPGDMLYLPPQLAHWGVALDDQCITYSIGFRAPSKAEILEDFLQEKISELTEDDRFTDPDFQLQTQPGLIGQSAIDQITAILHEAISNETDIKQWFGRFMTRPKLHEAEFFSDTDIEDFDPPALSSKELRLTRNPTSRFCYLPPSEGAQCDLFVNGEQLAAGERLCQLLCNQSRFDQHQLKAAILEEKDQQVIDYLLQQQFLIEG